MTNDERKRQRWQYRVTGTYTARHMRGHTCSVFVYTALTDPAKVIALCRSENPWMNPTAVAGKLPVPAGL